MEQSRKILFKARVLTILLKYNSKTQASEINDKEELNKIANSIIREKNNDKIK
jgi:hypothetical protein